MNMKMKMNSLYKLILTSSIILILSIACITSSNPINFNISLYQPIVDRYQTKDITKDAYILNFWFPSCGPCAKELPHIEKLNNEFGDKVEIIGIQMIGIDNTHDGLTFAQKLNLSYKLGYNPDNSTIKKYKINSFPTTIFVSKSDNKFIIWDGYIGYDDLLINTKKIIKGEK